MTQIEIIVHMDTRTVSMVIGDKGGTLIEVELNVPTAVDLARELTTATIKIRARYPKVRDPTAR